MNTGGRVCHAMRDTRKEASNMYRIICNIVLVDEHGYSWTIGVPTFDLDETIHGLTSTESAERHATALVKGIIAPFDQGQLKHIAVSAVRIV